MIRRRTMVIVISVALIAHTHITNGIIERKLIDRYIAAQVLRQKGLNALLLQSVMNSNVQTIRSLLAQGARANARDVNTRSALMLAVQSQQPVIAQLLLEEHADINQQDRFGETALHYAARAGNVDMITLLMAYKPDVTLKDRNGATATDLIEQNGDNSAALFN